MWYWWSKRHSTETGAYLKLGANGFNNNNIGMYMKERYRDTWMEVSKVLNSAAAVQMSNEEEEEVGGRI